MFVDKAPINELHYLIMLQVFNGAQGGEYVVESNLLKSELVKIANAREVETALDQLLELSLLAFRSKDSIANAKPEDASFYALTWLGVAFLVNHANEYVLRIQKKFKDIPEKLIASLVPYLNLRVVPAA